MAMWQHTFGVYVWRSVDTERHTYTHTKRKLPLCNHGAFIVLVILNLSEAFLNL